MFECYRDLTPRYPKPEELGMEVDNAEELGMEVHNAEYLGAELGVERVVGSDQTNSVAPLPFFEESVGLLPPYVDVSFGPGAMEGDTDMTVLRSGVPQDFDSFCSYPSTDNCAGFQGIPDTISPSSSDSQGFDSSSPKNLQEGKVQVEVSTFECGITARPSLKNQDRDLTRNEKRREKNRVSAANSRNNKKMREQFLEEQVKISRNVITDLEKENESVRVELARAEMTIMDLEKRLHDEIARRSEGDIKDWLKLREPGEDANGKR